MDAMPHKEKHSIDEIVNMTIQIASAIDEIYAKMHGLSAEISEQISHSFDEKLDHALQSLHKCDQLYLQRAINWYMDIQTDLLIWKSSVALGAALKMMRVEKRLSIIDLMENTGLSAQKILSIEAGVTSPYASEIYCLCKGLTITVDDLNVVKLRQMSRAFLERI